MLTSNVETNKQQQHSSLGTVTFDLAPSHQRAHIRSVLAARKRKSCLLESSPLHHTSIVPASSDSIPSNNSVDIKKEIEQEFDDLMINGLPSPPVDSPKTEFPTHDDPSLNTTLSTSFSNSLDVKQQQENLSAQHIQSKLTALREEKHRLFQLMKRLVEQEEHQQHTITNTQQSIRKKRPSRWQPSSQQQQQQQQQQYSTRTTFTTASRPYQTQSRSHGYFGQPSVIHHPHQPYLY